MLVTTDLRLLFMYDEEKMKYGVPPQALRSSNVANKGDSQGSQSQCKRLTKTVARQSHLVVDKVVLDI